MAERKLTAEEKAAQDAAAENAPTAQAPTATATKPGSTVRLAPPPFVTEFRVGDTVLTDAGVEVDAGTAKDLHDAAKRSGIQLREL
jgi:hypothetical protein